MDGDERKEGENSRIAYAVHAKRSKVAPVRCGINVWPVADG